MHVLGFMKKVYVLLSSLRDIQVVVVFFLIYSNNKVKNELRIANAIYVILATKQMKKEIKT